MRIAIALCVGLVALTGCGETTVTDRIDALLESGESYAHTTLPSDARMREIQGDVSDYPGAAESLDESRRATSTRRRLRETEHGRAVLDAGEAVVPELVSMLGDDTRRTLAAVFLAEIGGQKAAEALLTQWRSLREKRLRKHVYVHLVDPDEPDSVTAEGGYRYLSAGSHCDGVETEFYRELLMALSYCALPVSAAIAADARVAMDESERRSAQGEDLSGEERQAPTDAHPLGTTEHWSTGVVETADEGLEILAMSGAPEAPALFARALDSPVRSIRHTAVQNAYFLGDAVRPLVPAIVALWDDAGFQHVVAMALSSLTGEHWPSDSHTDEERTVYRERVKAKLQDMGYLPR